MRLGTYINTVRQKQPVRAIPENKFSLTYMMMIYLTMRWLTCYKYLELNLTMSCYERLRNERPTLVVPPDVSTSVKKIWRGNVLLLETFLVKFLLAPEPFLRKDALGWVWGFSYISICSILWRSWTGRGDFCFGISMKSRAGILLWAPSSHAGFLAKDFNLLLDFNKSF